MQGIVWALQQPREEKHMNEELRKLIAKLPEQAATTGRDFGRGYALAVRDVLAVLDRLDTQE